MLESFHGAFDKGNLDGILSESRLVGFGALGSTFSYSVLLMLQTQWRSVSVFTDLQSLFVL